MPGRATLSRSSARRWTSGVSRSDWPWVETRINSTNLGSDFSLRTASLVIGLSRWQGSVENLLYELPERLALLAGGLHDAAPDRRLDAQAGLHRRNGVGRTTWAWTSHFMLPVTQNAPSSIR